MSKVDDDKAVIREEVTENGSKRAALYISILAVLLAVTNLGGSNATKDFMANYIGASDTYAFFQAKSIRQTSYQLAHDQLKIQIESQPGLPERTRSDMLATLDKYRDSIRKYDSDPETGEGKKELLEKARAMERQRDKAARKDPYFDHATALLEIAIVTASVATMLEVTSIMIVSVVLAVAATFLMINGYMLLVSLPFF
jgi:hypothetical protein